MPWGVRPDVSGPSPREEDRAVLAGVQYLKAHAAGRSCGETAMIALALLKAEVPPSDPVLQACLAKLRARFTSSSYEPEMGPGPGTYEAAATAMVFANLDAAANRALIDMIAAYLQGPQNANGSWDYSDRTQGDTSISQYAVLGLWEAENAGRRRLAVGLGPRRRMVHVDAERRPEAGITTAMSRTPETLSMTAAGVGSLMICRRQLDRYRQQKRGTSPLLTLAGRESRARIITLDLQRPDRPGDHRGAWRGSRRISSRPMSAIVGQSRVLRALRDRADRGPGRSPDDRPGRLVRQGGAIFSSRARAPTARGLGTHGTEMNTVWAILFLTKSTAKTIRRITITPNWARARCWGAASCPRT